VTAQLLGLLFSGCAHAAVLASEPFSLVDYNLGPLEGQNPLPKQNGYSWGWGILQDQGSTFRSVIGSTLSYEDAIQNSLAVSGGAVEVRALQSGGILGLASANRALDIDGAFAPFSSAGTLVDQGTLYLSFLLQTTQFAGSHGSYLVLSAGSGEALRIGSRDNFGFIVGQGNSSHVTVASDDASTHLFLARMDLNPDGADRVTVWMDPVLGLASVPAGGAVFSGAEMSFNGVTMEVLTTSHASLFFDELRFGAAMEDVMPMAASASRSSFLVSEPGTSTMAMVAFAGFVFLHVGTYALPWRRSRPFGRMRSSFDGALDILIDGI